jgi:hypothetical protein
MFRVKAPMKAAHFLKAFYEHLHKGKELENQLNQTAKRATLGKPGQFQARNIFIFKSLSVLGLTDCHLSRHSIDLLRVCLFSFRAYSAYGLTRIVMNL